MRPRPRRARSARTSGSGCPLRHSRWTTIEGLCGTGTRIVINEVEPDLWGLRPSPRSASDNRRCSSGRRRGRLFDCVGYVDDAGRRPGRARARPDARRRPRATRTCTASRPSGPRPSAACRDPRGSRPRVGAAGHRSPSSTTSPVRWPRPDLHRVGGHFAARQPSSSGPPATRAAACSSPATPSSPTPDRRTVSFMRSYPNRIPCRATSSSGSSPRSRDLHFDRLYNNFGAAVPRTRRASSASRPTATRHGRAGTTTT